MLALVFSNCGNPKKQSNVKDLEALRDLMKKDAKVKDLAEPLYEYLEEEELSLSDVEEEICGEELGILDIGCIQYLRIANKDINESKKIKLFNYLRLIFLTESNTNDILIPYQDEF